MSTKHFFPDTNGIVMRALESFVARNPQLQLDYSNRFVFSKSHSPSQISIISGGGSGHEPAWSGYVGDGMLTAAVSGEVFASPSAKQIMAAIRTTPSDVGIILCITNYTGDKLHFGLAREKAEALGHKVALVSMSEDAALGRNQVEHVGRRGLAGNLLVLKLIGAASQKGWSFDRCVELGRLCNEQLVTIGTSLDHCHIPGRIHQNFVPETACELGMGIHNEPGLRTINPMPSAEDLMKEMLLYLVNPNDKERAYVKFNTKDEVALLVNNFGGLSNLEFEALTSIARTQLEKNWGITPSRVYAFAGETSLNGPGFSITLGNISGIAKSFNIPDTEIIELLDAPTTAPAWPKNGYAYQSVIEVVGELRNRVQEKGEVRLPLQAGSQVPKYLIKALQNACNTAIAAEATITKYDIQLGDGDCGHAVQTVCTTILLRLSQSSEQFTFQQLLDKLQACVEEMGGSLGAIISIMLTRFAANLSQAHSDSSPLPAITEVSKAAANAVENLKEYTNARIGDRTVMDSLIPFCNTLVKENNFSNAVQAAKMGALDTKNMKARFGRAVYIHHNRVEKIENAPLDPGAYAVSIFLQGLSQGLSGGKYE